MRRVLLLFAFLFITLWGNASPFFPVIRQTIGRRDLYFKQLEREIALYYRLSSQGQPLPPLSFYHYQVEEEMDIFSLASHFGLPYGTLISLNNWDNNKILKKGEMVLIPNQVGLFTRQASKTPLEDMIQMRLGPYQTPAAFILPENKDNYYFWSGAKLHPVERAYFLKILFQSPLKYGRLTSGFGYRASPFTGHPSFHNGIDLAADLGSKVVSAREGVVTEAGSDPLLGNYVLLTHAGGYQTLYGHLRIFFVTLNQKIPSGMIIGEVGISGLTTGPHLHFEIRRNDESQDPLDWLNKGRQ